MRLYCDSMERTHLVVCNYQIHKCRQELRGGKWQMRLVAKLGKLFNRCLRHQGGVETLDLDGPIVFNAFVNISLGVHLLEVATQVGK